MVKILLTEYVVSTYGLNNYSYISLLAEAYAMTRSLVKILKHAGVDVIITLSNQIHNMLGRDIKVDDVVIVEGNYIDVLEELRKDVDYAIAIAPPHEMITIVEILRDKFLGPSYDLTKILSDKYEATLMLRKCGLKTPLTLSAYSSSEKISLDEISFPVVVKPSMSAGAECVYIARDKDSFAESIRKITKCDPKGYVVVQEYVEGIHGSISMVVYNSEIYLYSLNLQLISVLNNRIVYNGNVLPLRNKDYVQVARNVVEKIVKCLSGLKGYIGIDVVWNDEDMYVIEVNPRFTTAGVAISELYPDLGKILIGYRLPSKERYLGNLVQGYAYIIKNVNHIERNCLESDSLQFDLCLDRLITIGRVAEFKDVLDILFKQYGDLVKNLAYNITIVSNEIN